MWIIAAVVLTAITTWKFLHWIVSNGWYSITVDYDPAAPPRE